MGPERNAPENGIGPPSEGEGKKLQWGRSGMLRKTGLDCKKFHPDLSFNGAGAECSGKTYFKTNGVVRGISFNGAGAECSGKLELTCVSDF